MKDSKRRNAQIKYIREHSAFEGTRTFFRFACLFPVLVTVCGLPIGIIAQFATNNKEEASRIEHDDMRMIVLGLGGIACWLITRLLIDIADLLLVLINDSMHSDEP